MSAFSTPLLNNFTNSLRKPWNAAINVKDEPNYFAKDPSILNSHATFLDFRIGTGADVYAHHANTLLSTQDSLTIVTCFWARSKSLKTLNDVLRKLSAKAGGREDGQKLRVRICFSSLSVAQKLFHPRSTAGKSWHSSTWMSKLGLPNPSELTGLDLKIKSIFILPFSVMHPKFIIIDQQTILLPSCNVSWEDWLEGCIQLSGDIVHQFIRFYETFWCDNSAHAATAPQQITPAPLPPTNTPCIFLPSPHHTNPHFHPFPFTHPPTPPPTPLNTFLLTAIAHATRSITITTPNLTCLPLISALLTSLTTGVNITIYTSRRMMLFEQLLTAGTTTSICIWRLKRRYRKLLLAGTARPHLSDPDPDPNPNPNHDLDLDLDLDPEAQRHIGQLRIYYFNPNPTSTSTATLNSPSHPLAPSRANKLHFKSTIIDDHIVILGSGNMDRASWFTSQELGVAFASPELAATVQREFHAFVRGDRDGGGTYLTQII